MNWLDPEEVRELLSGGAETPDAVDWAEVFGVGEPTHFWPSTSEEIARRDLMVARAAAVEFVRALASKYRTRHPGSCATRDGFTVCTCYIGAVELIAQRLEGGGELA